METIDVLKEVLGGVEKTLDTDSVIGSPIDNGNVTVIPVSKKTVGFGSGGGEMESNKTLKKKEFPLGAVGGGASIQPLGFLVLDGFEVRFIKTSGGEKWNEQIESVLDLFLQK